MVAQAGFTIVEASIAAALVGVVTAAAFSGVGQPLEHAAESFAETKASRLVTARLEWLRASRDECPPGTTQVELSAEQTQGLDRCRCVQTVTVLQAGLCEVRVELSWYPRGADRPRRFGLTTWREKS